MYIARRPILYKVLRLTDTLIIISHVCNLSDASNACLLENYIMILLLIYNHSVTSSFRKANKQKHLINHIILT